MPTSKQTRRASSSEAMSDEPLKPTDALLARADALYRSADEAVRQRERYAHLVEGGADEVEQTNAFSMACMCDKSLAASLQAYERAAGEPGSHGDQDWWHRANGLWHAAREYARRHQGCDDASRKLRNHSPEMLGELAMEYDLEASAVLALRHAAQQYCKVRPQATLNGRPQAPAVNS